MFLIDELLCKIYLINSANLVFIDFTNLNESVKRFMINTENFLKFHLRTITEKALMQRMKYY